MQATKSTRPKSPTQILCLWSTTWKKYTTLRNSLRTSSVRANKSLTCRRTRLPRTSFRERSRANTSRTSTAYFQQWSKTRYTLSIYSNFWKTSPQRLTRKSSPSKIHKMTSTCQIQRTDQTKQSAKRLNDSHESAAAPWLETPLSARLCLLLSVSAYLRLSSPLNPNDLCWKWSVLIFLTIFFHSEFWFRGPIRLILAQLGKAEMHSQSSQI